MMSAKKINYSIGSIISIRDDHGRELAVCRVEAMDGKGVVIGRFHVVDSSSIERDTKSLHCEFLWRFGDLNIVNGRWPIVGIAPIDESGASLEFRFLGGVESGTPWITTYDVCAMRTKEERIVGGLPPVLTRDSLKGAAFVEARLKQIVGGERTPFD